MARRSLHKKRPLAKGSTNQDFNELTLKAARIGLFYPILPYSSNTISPSPL